jgi:transposase
MKRKVNALAQKENRSAASKIVLSIITFLQLFMSETLAKRIISIVLIAAGSQNEYITELTGLCNRSIRELRKKLKNGEVGNELLQVGGGGRKSKMAGLEEFIIEKIETNNYHSQQEIADMVYKERGIKVHRTTIGRLLKKNGIKRLKCGSFPAKANVNLQRSFYEDTLLPLMKQAEDGLVSLLFLDASHFVMGCDFLGYVYGKARRFIKTFSGRKRYNVLGALDFVSKKVLTVTNDTYITATEICEMLKKISQSYAGKTVHVILDNARYQKCTVVQELAKELGIRLLFIPPYSPNLNLIERLWKFTKSQLRSRYYSQFDVFQKTIDLIIDSTHTLYKDAINQLISEKIQLFDDLIAVTENSFRENPPVKNIRKAA